MTANLIMCEFMTDRIEDPESLDNIATQCSSPLFRPEILFWLFSGQIILKVDVGSTQDTLWIVIIGYQVDYLVLSKVPTFLICILIIVIARGLLRHLWETRLTLPFPILILKIHIIGKIYNKYISNVEYHCPKWH